VRPKENYRPYIFAAAVLMLVTIIVFQIYIWSEPARIQSDEAADKLAAETAGRELYNENCGSCHGEDGLGGVGPALNSRELLESTADEVFFGLTRLGIPGTLMPAWSQDFGGPFTDEQISQITAYIRSWEADAPVISPVALEPDPVRGAEIYDQTCFVCHGEDGLGGSAPPLNDTERLHSLDDVWYRSTIARGRPAKGMPTWGTVLSPAQINDVVALVGAWREGETVQAEIPLATFVTNALFAIREFDRPDAVFYLEAALALVDGAQAKEIQEIIELVEDNQLFKAESQLIALLPPEEMGRASFDTNCAPCHGDDGGGGMGPNLHANSFIQANSDEELLDFILVGRRGSAMDGFEGILSEEELINLVILLRTWQE
jgi:mono/diheme cytochrome c family protein